MIEEGQILRAFPMQRLRDEEGVCKEIARAREVDRNLQLSAGRVSRRRGGLTIRAALQARKETEARPQELVTCSCC